MKDISYQFRVSNRRLEKYDALLSDGRIVSFGGIRSNGDPYRQYRDTTPLKTYRAFDHNDAQRRDRYYKRHGAIDNVRPYSADWFSKKFFW